MKFQLTLFMLLVAASGVGAQTSSDKERCYNQSRKYVQDKNKDTNGTWEWQGAHLDAVKKVCYVQLGDMISGGNGALTTLNYVEDAFEGTQYAMYWEDSTSSPTIITCRVEQTTCKYEADYHKLVDKLMGRP